MSQRELLGLGDGAGGLLDLAADPDAELPQPDDPPDVRGYVELALRGGLPQVATASNARRGLLLDAYVDQLLTRDVELTGARRNAVLLRRYLRAIAASTAGVPATELPRPHLFHLRDTNGEREVDLVAEYPDGSVVAFEVKAGASPSRDDARHLRWLRDRLGDRFRRGIVLHTGPRSFQHEPDIWYLPIAAFWPE